jgi:hypothetical protein
MATELRIKRRASTGAAGAPSALKNGEIAYNENDSTLYYGFGDDGSGNATSIPPIAGKGAFVDKTSTQTIAGVKTFSSSPIAPTPAANDNSTKAATTEYVDRAVGGAGGTQAQNSVYAGPATGGSGAPAFRALVPADVPTLTSSKISDFDAEVANVITAQKGAASGLCPLDSSSLIPSAYLPSYVDDVLEVANFAALPGTGVTGKIYVALDTNKIYRWSGSGYIEIDPSPGSTDSVAEGSVNLYFTAARVLASVLSGLSLATATVISSADTVLSALGKLQAQVTLRLVTTNNLSDLTNAPTARTNLGLGTVATQSASAVAFTGGTADGLTLTNCNVDFGTF